MDNNKELDKFIRDNVSDVEFSGDKDNWELLNYQLKERTRKKQKIRAAKFLLPFLLVASGGLCILMPFNEEKDTVGSRDGTPDVKVQAKTSPVHSSQDTEVKGNNIQRDEDENISLLTMEKSKSVSPDVQPYNPANDYDKNLVSETQFETFGEKADSPQNLSDEELSAIINSYAWGSDSFKIEITNAGKAVNSAYSDFAPVISADGSTMFFTSRRPVTEKEMKQRKQAMERVYSCSLNSKKNKWANTFMLTHTINVDGRNNSAIGLSNDGQRMLLYRDDIYGNGDIYESVLKGTEWTIPVLIPEPVNTKYHESSASISPDGKTLYFVSDRPGGTGGRDIWYSIQEATGKWSNATNIGAPVNTQYDEEGIFIHPDGKTIYFSSKGHNSTGGYDVYRTMFINGKWSVPLNLGPPLNTQGDDVYFVLEASGTVGYYTSARAGGSGEKDIYKVTFHWIAQEDKPATPELVLLKGVIRDNSGKPFEASIEIIDNEKNEVVTKLSSNSVTGKYLVSLPAGKNYGIHVNAKDYLFHSENFNIPESVAFSEVDKNIELKKIEVGKTIVLKNIFHDFDKATLHNESIAELERLVALMEEYPSLKIELSSHTDSKGAEDYNQNLSQARAQSVVDYLVSKNIRKDRLVAKGYGETKPVASNEHEDGTDNPEGRQLNRRTEFKILAK